MTRWYCGTSLVISSFVSFQEPLYIGCKAAGAMASCYFLALKTGVSVLDMHVEVN